MNYTVIEKEFLAMIFAFEKFRPSLIGSHAIVFTDHVTPKHLILKRNTKLNLVRWMLLLQEFDCEIKDVKALNTLLLIICLGLYVVGVLRPLFMSSSLMNNSLQFNPTLGMLIL